MRVRTTRRAAPKLPKSSRVSVGVHADAGDHPHAGVPVATVANWAEYGTTRTVTRTNERGETVETQVVHTPARAPLRTWFDSNQAELNELVRKYSASPEQLALKLQASVQRYIGRGVPPPNAPSTIRAKGSSKPLIDSGVLRSAYTGWVEQA